MANFSHERELEIRQEIEDWWNDRDWREKIEMIDPEGSGEFERLLEFAEEQQKAHDACQVRANGAWRMIDKRRSDQTKTILEALDAYLWDLAEQRGIPEDQFGERLTWGK